LRHSSFFVYIYSNSLHVSSTPVLIIRRINCINMISGICHSENKWMEHSARFVTPDSRIIPIQFCFDVLLMMCLFCLFCIAEFYVLLTVHLGSILVNNQLDAQFFFSYIFIPILYMFRAPLCSSPGEPIVLIPYLVYVTLKTIHLFSEWHIPDVELMQSILLVIGRGVLETCRELE